MYNTYLQCKKLANTRKRKLCNHTYLTIRNDGCYGIKFHDTEVVIHYPAKTVLNSGGWKTVSTKERINTFSKISLTQNKGVWFADNVPFADGMIIYASGYITGKGEQPVKTIALRKQINQFSSDYADHFMAGNIPKPSGGCCWNCLMNTPSCDHIKAHIRENYYVPSMLNRASDHLSMWAKSYIHAVWYENRIPPGCDFVHEQIKSVIRKYCLHSLGLPV